MKPAVCTVASFRAAQSQIHVLIFSLKKIFYLTGLKINFWEVTRHVDQPMKFLLGQVSFVTCPVKKM